MDMDEMKSFCKKHGIKFDKNATFSSWTEEEIKRFNDQYGFNNSPNEDWRAKPEDKLTYSKYGQQNTEFFYPLLLDNKETHDAFVEELGEKAKALLLKAKNGLLTNDEEAVVHDTLYELIINCEQREFSLTGCGSEDNFLIEVMRFGPIYWIYAPEFEDIGYFNDKHKTLEVAKICYEPFLVDEK
jgi:hypothetical protein